MLSIHTILLSCGALCAMLLSSNARAAISGRNVDYRDGDTVCEGYLAFDDSTTAPRPAILVFHDWMGLTNHTRDVCNQLAKLGYAAFAADMYGKGVRPEDAKAAGDLAGKYKADRATVRRRAEAALAQIRRKLNILSGKTKADGEPAWIEGLENPKIESGKIAAIGYCFGGMCALELARDGAPLAGVVSFHGALDSPNPADGNNIKAKLLILHGADDPYVKKEDIEAFQNELRAAKVDWQMTYYANAVHAFTEPWAGNDNSKGAAYNPEAARRSWQAMRDFFGEIFSPAAK